MKVQFITTQTGERLVVLTEGEYDALRARAGDEEAEDRMTMRIAEDARRALASGEEILIPGWFYDAARAQHGRPLRGLREHRGLSQEQVARAAGIDQSDFREIERGEKQPTAEVLDRISDALQLNRAWLRKLELCPVVIP